ncbi:hypothetical protein FRB90_001999 [Tulasnella sp. 427]|nr:hypothetical protein FRB90_001999 [Tulasnella sp. 427]
MLSRPATWKFRRQSGYQQQAEQPTDVTYASVVVLILAFATLVGLGGWLGARKRRRAMKRKLLTSMAPPTPQIAIQEYKPEYDRVSLQLPPPASPAPPSPIHLSPVWSAQPIVSPRVSYASETASKPSIERPSRATLPAIKSKRLSLHLPVSSSLSLELQGVADSSIGSTPSLVISSTSDSSISATTDSDVSCVTQSQSEPLTLLQKRLIDDSVHSKSGHTSMFTLPPIITSPAFTEVTEWEDGARSSALLSIVVSVTAPPHPVHDVAEPVTTATPHTPATLDLPFTSPQDLGSPVPTTPEIVLRGMRSQIFESPIIPSQFSTPTVEADEFEEGQEGETNDEVDEITPTESILNALGLTAGKDDVEAYSQSGQSTPRAPSRVSQVGTTDFLVRSPSSSFEAASPVPFDNTCAVDEFTREILNMIPRGDTPTPSGSGNSLNQALTGIGMAFVVPESNSEAELAMMSSMDSVVARRYIARELAPHFGTSNTLGSLSSVEHEDVGEEEGEEERLESSPTIDAIIKMEQLLERGMSIEETVEGSADANSPVSSPEFDLKANGLAEGNRQSWVLMQAVRTLVSTARSAVVGPRPPSLETTDPYPGLIPPPLSAASTSSFESSLEEPQTPLCPPLVVVTSPSVGVLLKRFGPTPELIMEEAEDKAVFVIRSDSDSEYGASDEESGSEYDVDEPFHLEDYAHRESSETDLQQTQTTLQMSSSSVISPSSSKSSNAASTRIPALRRNKLKCPVVDFTEGGKHTVQVVHRPKRNPSLRIGHFPHFNSTVVRRHRAASHIPRYRRHKRASKEIGATPPASRRDPQKQTAVQGARSSPSLSGMTEGEDNDLLVNETFPGRISCSSTETE